MKRKNIETARRLRRDDTAAERRLWRRLHNRGLEGHKFLRPQSIGPFVADFVSREATLVVEIDGGQHAFRGKRDRARTAALERLGYKVIRFWNNEVTANIEGILFTIPDTQ